MEEEHYHHHHHHEHHHGHHTTDQNQSLADESVNARQSVTSQGNAFVTVPRPGAGARLTVGGVQPTSSFHSVSSIDSSAEMARYFPDAQTPSLSPFRHHQEEEELAQSTTATVTTTTNLPSLNAGPYANVSTPRAMPIVQAPVMTQRPRAPPAAPPGIPSYPTQVEGLSISQALVNDVIVDLQSKVINESQQQFLSESTTGNYMAPLPPIYIRAPNPTIILRSDLNRLRAEFQHNVRVRAQQSRGGFSRPRFPVPPPQYSAPGYY